MDFGSILHVAQKNEKLPKKEVRKHSLHDTAMENTI